MGMMGVEPIYPKPHLSISSLQGVLLGSILRREGIAARPTIT